MTIVLLKANAQSVHLDTPSHNYLVVLEHAASHVPHAVYPLQPNAPHALLDIS